MVAAPSEDEVRSERGGTAVEVKAVQRELWLVAV